MEIYLLSKEDKRIYQWNKHKLSKGFKISNTSEKPQIWWNYPIHISSEHMIGG